MVDIRLNVSTGLTAWFGLCVGATVEALAVNTKLLARTRDVALSAVRCRGRGVDALGTAWRLTLLAVEDALTLETDLCTQARVAAAIAVIDVELRVDARLCARELIALTHQARGIPRRALGRGCAVSDPGRCSGSRRGRRRRSAGRVDAGAKLRVELATPQCRQRQGPQRDAPREPSCRCGNQRLAHSVAGSRQIGQMPSASPRTPAHSRAVARVARTAFSSRRRIAQAAAPTAHDRTDDVRQARARQVACWR